MAKLIATHLCSADLFTSDEEGSFDWAVPPAEVHAFVNGLERQSGTYLYGRRLYETMRFWETVPEDASIPGDYGALWRAAEKVVYSRTLEAPLTARTRIERDFDPAAVARLKAAATADLSIGGATLAGTALLAGLVDEVRLLVAPVLVGGGTRALPAGARARLDLLDTRTFEGGWVHLRYGIA